MAKAIRYHKQASGSPPARRGPGRRARTGPGAHPAHGDRRHFVDTYQRSGLYPMQLPAVAATRRRAWSTPSVRASRT